MSTLFQDDPFDISVSRKALVLALAASTMIVPPWVWPRLIRDLLKTDFPPHLFCSLRNPALIWTHVISDALIGCAVHHSRCDPTPNTACEGEAPVSQPDIAPSPHELLT